MPTGSATGRSLFALLGCLLAGCLLVACNPSRDALPDLVPTATTIDQIAELALPDTTRFTESSVVKQIEEQVAEANQARSIEGQTAQALAEILGETGMLLMTYELRTEARKAFESALGLAADDPRWLYYLAHIYKQEGNMEAAASLFHQLVEVDPAHLLGRIHLAGALQAIGRDEDAQVLIDQIQREHGEIAIVLLMQGDAALRREDYEAALRHFKRVLQIQPSATKIHYQLSQLYQKLGDSARAEAELALQGEGQVEIKDPMLLEVQNLNRSSFALVQRGDLQMNVGRAERAAEIYREAMESAPDQVVPHAKLAAALATQGDFDGAIEQFRSAIQLATLDESFSTSDVSGMQQQIGRLESKRLSFDAAEVAFESAIQSDATNAAALGDLADLYRGSARCEQAISLYQQAVELDGSQPIWRVSHGLCLTRLERHADALAVLETAHALAPNDADVRDALARLLAASSEDSIRDGERALSLAFSAASKDMSVDHLETLAMAQAELGDFENAIANQKLAIERAVSGQAEWHAALLANLDRYLADEPCRKPWPDFLFEK